MSGFGVDSDFRGVADSMSGMGLKEKYRLLIAAMTPAEQAQRVQEVTHVKAVQPPPRIVNERFLRKTVPMGFRLDQQTVDDRA